MKIKPLLIISLFCLVVMISADFAILRSLRNTLAVTDLGGNALHIPYFELFGTLPGSVLMTWFLGRLLGRFSLNSTFQITLGIFLTFFLLFAFFVYPRVSCWKQAFPGIAIGFSMGFYIMAELWKVALLTLLFWGLVNEHMPLTHAKKLYAPLMLAGSLGTLIAGPIITAFSFCDDWASTLSQLLLVVTFIGCLAGILYYGISRMLSRETPIRQYAPTVVSLQASFGSFMNSSYLTLLGGIVLADYVAYSLGEVIFLDALKQIYPQPQDYCRWLGHLSLLSGILTGIGALWVAPKILEKCRWEVAALATPVCVLITEGAFFLMLRLPEGSQILLGWSYQQWLEVIVWLGSLQYCLCRAAKYTLFDSSRELAFLMLPSEARLPGKLVVDGVCARIGRGAASFLSLLFAHLCGGVLASAWLAGLVAFLVSAGWVTATRRLGGLIDRPGERQEA